MVDNKLVQNAFAAKLAVMEHTAVRAEPVELQHDRIVMYDSASKLTWLYYLRIPRFNGNHIAADRRRPVNITWS